MPVLRRVGVGAAVAALAAASASAPAVSASEPAAGSPQVRLAAAFDRDARLGEATAVRLDLQIDSGPTSATTVEVRYPAGLGVTTSGLGLDPCVRKPSDFSEVLIAGTGLAGCPPNSVMGLGTARALVRYGGETITPEIGRITLLAGPVQPGQLGLVAHVDGDNPLGVKLAYAGAVREARPPYGGVMSLTLPPVPNVFEAEVALVRATLTIGGRDIVYVRRAAGQRTRYRPGGVALPDRCPRGGLRFAAHVGFRDGTSAAARTTVRCRTILPRVRRDGEKP